MLARTRIPASWALALALLFQAMMGPLAAHAFILCLGCSGSGIGSGCADAVPVAKSVGCCSGDCEAEGEQGPELEPEPCGCVDVAIDAQGPVTLHRQSGDVGAHSIPWRPAPGSADGIALALRPLGHLQEWPPGRQAGRPLTLLALSTGLRI